MNQKFLFTLAILILFVSFFNCQQNTTNTTTTNTTTNGTSANGTLANSTTTTTTSNETSPNGTNSTTTTSNATTTNGTSPNVTSANTTTTTTNGTTTNGTLANSTTTTTINGTTNGTLANSTSTTFNNGTTVSNGTSSNGTSFNTTTYPNGTSVTNNTVVVVPFNPFNPANFNSFLDPLCNSTSSVCNQTGTDGVDLVTICVNITTCSTFRIEYTCITNYCNDCSISIDNAVDGNITIANSTAPNSTVTTTTTNSTINSNGTNSTNTTNTTITPAPTVNNTQSRKCNCLNCKTKIFFNNGTVMQSPLIPYSLPYFNSNITSQDMAKKIIDSFKNTIDMQLYLFNSQICTDTRVNDIFGIQPANPNYQMYCKALQNDFAQVYAAFRCSNQFCNMKGTCTSITYPNMTVISTTTVQTSNQTQQNTTSQIIPGNRTETIPTCKCIEGWKGKRCVFTSVDYAYGLNWTNGIGRWIDGINNNGTLNITNPSELISLIQITTELVKFSSNILPEDKKTVRGVIEKLMRTIYTADVDTSRPDISNPVLNLVETCLSSTDSLVGVNPVDILLILGAPNGTNATLYGYVTAPFDQQNDMRVVLPTGGPRRALIGKKLLNRLIQANKTILFNTESPIISIPKNITQAVRNGTTFSMAFVRIPNSMLNRTHIQSQIVGARGFYNISRNATVYPQDAGSMKYEIPWVNVPFRLTSGTYVDQCTVYNWDGIEWKQSKNCNLDPFSDVNRAVVYCKSYEIIGVGCRQIESRIKTNDNLTLTLLPVANSADRFTFTLISLLAIAVVIVI